VTKKAADRMSVRVKHDLGSPPITDPLLVTSDIARVTTSFGECQQRVKAGAADSGKLPCHRSTHAHIPSCRG
jgi:hypothetical protein